MNKSRAKTKKQRFLKDFLKIGRIGKEFKLFGAPEGMEGPFANSKEAEEAMTFIVSNPDDYEVIDRKIRLKKD